MKKIATKNKTVETKGLIFQVRPGTSDIKAIQEVVERHSYANRKSFTVNLGDRWLDLGANIGAFSVWASFQGGRCFPFEPVAESAALANANLRVNGFCANVDQRAVTNDGKNVTMGISHANPWRNGQFRKKHDETRVIPALRLSEAVGIYKTDCIKMDIEGSEHAILDEFPALKGVRKLVLEYHFDVDPLIENFLRRMQVLRTHFQHVKHPTSLPEGGKWNVFPAACIVWAWNF